MKNTIGLFSILLILFFELVSCNFTNGSPSPAPVPPGPQKKEISYSVFITHLLTEDGNIFTKNNVIVTAAYDDGTTGKVTDFTIEPASFEVNVGPGVVFTFKRGNDSKTFRVFKANQTTTDTATSISYSGSISGGTYVQFGDYAKTKITITAGMTFSEEPARNGWYIGSDGNYYGKAGDDYYKVEPIVWRVADTDFNGTGKSLLIAETILEGGIPYYYDAAENYDVKKLNCSTPEESIQSALSKDSKIRYLGKTKPIFTNNYEYSQVRAFLNGYDYYNLDEKVVSDYKYCNFLDRAFSKNAQNLIVTSTLKNDRKSSLDPKYGGYSGDPENPGSNIDAIDEKSSAKLDLTCGDTNDKVFILSEWESVTYLNGEDTTYGGEGDDKRKRATTEYSGAKGAIADTYMIRTPYYKNGCNIRVVDDTLMTFDNFAVNNSKLGIVPAIVISK